MSYNLDTITPLLRVFTCMTEDVVVDFDHDYMHYANENAMKAHESSDPEGVVHKMFAKHPMVFAIFPHPHDKSVLTAELIQGMPHLVAMMKRGLNTPTIHLLTSAWHCRSREDAKLLAAEFSTETPVSKDEMAKARAEAAEMLAKRAGKNARRAAAAKASRKAG